MGKWISSLEWHLMLVHPAPAFGPPLAGGVTIKKTASALVVGIYAEGVSPGDCNVVVENLVRNVIMCACLAGWLGGLHAW